MEQSVFMVSFFVLHKLSIKQKDGKEANFGYTGNTLKLKVLQNCTVRFKTRLDLLKAAISPRSMHL